MDAKKWSTAALDNPATVSRLSDNLVDPPPDSSSMRPAARSACTWWVIVGFETLRLRASSADVVGVRASTDAIAYRVVSPSARNTDSAFTACCERRTGSRAGRSSSTIQFGEAASRAIGKYRLKRCALVSYFAHHLRVLNAEGTT